MSVAVHDAALIAGLKAAGHPLRLAILRALTSGEMNVGQIDDVAGIGQPTLSQQLAVLRKAGLVDTRREAKLIYYRLAHDRLRDLTAVFAQLTPDETAVPVAPPTIEGVARFARIG